MDKWAIAEMVYVLREMVDKFERRDLDESEQEVLMMAYEALRLPTQEIHFLANEIEGDERE